MFIGRIDVEAETPILWLPDAKNWLIWKDPDAGKDWRHEKGVTEDEMVGLHHRLNGHGFGWTLGVGDEQGGLACCSSWGCKESNTPERLNWTDAYLPSFILSKSKFLTRALKHLLLTGLLNVDEVSFLIPMIHGIPCNRTWVHGYIAHVWLRLNF